MQNDEVIWNVINKDFCSFKVKTLREDMCRNEYNVTGKCNRVSCPLANSNYGTVIEHQGALFLCLKTIERAHMPKKLWEKIRLPLNIKQAKEVIEREMKNVYKKHQIERCKRRAIKLKQMLDRMRRLELKPKEKLVPVKQKTERRERAREKKAEVAAHLEDVIESELLKRLQQGVYGTLYNFDSEKTAQAEEDEEEVEVQQGKAEKKGAVAFEEDEEDVELSDFSESEGSEEFDFDESDEEEDIEDLEFSEEDMAEPVRKAPRRGLAATSVRDRRRAEQRQSSTVSEDEESAEEPGKSPMKSASGGRLLQLSGLKRQLARRGQPREAIRFEEEDEREAMLQEQ
ncbi:putative MAK16 protein [Neospora caninum Liverpool]|uniref:Protein MAK16 homolog n=1 Tax=Neospora caninum (strain Liverpool) TaxID=572307 RepID=F0VR33_NEOCL|nr:putative MAK16 protein [Neospora caninum Liverpool]CBZ56180.1 putative MAK16 protein [Neospora caninum Liverpool]CEL70939.1 TPA: MAK16 protein, putative [Neospora caninum Liverpool]|eukprot:XP_003886206.1 putative MAK16 protein [Neospora caninum Liverpool]